VTKQLIAARCNVDLQGKSGYTAIHWAARGGHAAVTKQLLAARSNVKLQANDGATALRLAERQGHAEIAALIRNSKRKGADKGKKDTLLQASPAQTKKQQEDADRAIKELLEEEDKDAAAATTVSQKKKQAKKAGKERKERIRRDAADGQDGNQKEEHAEEQKHSERTEAKAVSEKNKTESVAAVAVEAALAEQEEEVRRQEAAERQERRRKEEEERQKEETDFMRAWGEPIYLLENAKGKVGPRRPWMQGIRESKYDFSKMEEDEYEKLMDNLKGMQAPKIRLNVGASEFVPSLGGFAEDGSGTGRMEGDNDLVDVERNMENDTAEDSLPGDMSDEQWLSMTSDIGAEKLTLWYTDQVRKWYRHAV
jgi:hypothetical protein